MKKLVVALGLFVASVGTASAQQEAPWANKLFGNKTTHDFGVVARGSTLKYSFPLKNIYAVPLQITDIRVSCGCVSYEPSAKGMNLNPQQEGTLDITMDARKFSGQKSVKIYVTVGPKFVSTAVLEVKANARGDVVVNPGEVNFGVVMQGQQPTLTVDVDYAGYKDFEIKQVVKPADAPFNVVMQKVAATPPTNGQAGRVSYRLTATLNADAPAGAFKNDLVLKTNDPQSEALIVTVEGNVQASLSASPTALNLGSVNLNATKTFKVQVRGGNRPFLITKVLCDSPDISADLPAAAAQMHTVTLRWQPKTAGPFTRQVTFVTDLDKNTSVTVTIMGNAVP